MMESESNKEKWIKYSNVNSYRVFLSTDTYVSTSDVQIKELNLNDRIINSANLLSGKTTLLRATPSDYIKFDNVRNKLNELNGSDTLKSLKQNQIVPLIQMSKGGWNLSGITIPSTRPLTPDEIKWTSSYTNWKMIYAFAYVLAKDYGIVNFNTTNEPDWYQGDAKSNNLDPISDEEYAFAMKIYSDAMRAAVADALGVETKCYIYGPVLAGSVSTTLTQAILKGNRTNYKGENINFNLLDVFDKHQYSGTSASYGTTVDNAIIAMKTYLPNKVPLPITFSEHNYNTGSGWVDRARRGLVQKSDDVIVFGTVAQTYSNMLEKGVFGAWQFSFHGRANAVSNSTYYMFGPDRDSSKNLVQSVYTNSKIIRDGLPSQCYDGNQYTYWRTASDTLASIKSPQTLYINLKSPSAIIKTIILDTGDQNDVGKVGDVDILKNFTLFYTQDTTPLKTNWTTVPGIRFNETTPLKTNSLSIEFTNPFNATQLKLEVYDSGSVKVREIYISSEASPNDIGGSTKNAEVTRLFSKGFANEKPLYKTTITPGYTLSANTSFDKTSSNYYMWITVPNTLKTTAQIDLNKLEGVTAGNNVIVNTVSSRYFGDVSNVIQIPTTKKVTISLEPLSAILVTIPKTDGRVLAKYIDSLLIDATVDLDNASSNINTDKLYVGQGNSHNNVTYLQFDNSKVPLSDFTNIKRAILKVNGKHSDSTTSSPFNLMVYAIENNLWDEKTITANTAPNLKISGGYLEDNQLGKVTPLGRITFTNIQSYSNLDVTDFVRQSPNKKITFVLIKEMTSEYDLKDKRFVEIISKDSVTLGKPKLEIEY